MTPRKRSLTFMAVLAGACWAAAVFVFAGGVFAEDITSRILFGLIWVLTGTWWLVQFNKARRIADGPAAPSQDGASSDETRTGNSTNTITR